MRKVRTISGRKFIWKDEDIQYLKENYETKTNMELAVALKLNLTLVRTKLYELGYKRMELEYWTEEQVAYLKKHYKKIGDVELAEIFNECYYKQKGWTKKHIVKKRMYLGLKRTEKQKAAIKIRNTIAGRFSVNHYKRWLGKVSPVGTIRIWKNQFNKPFKVIKIEGGFVHYAPWLWLQHNDSIPEGHVIGFKDKDNMNVVIENLICIDRAEHAIRNRMIDYDLFPEEMQQTIVLISKLKSKIKQHGKKQS